jgi:hypothetical protein
MRNLNTVLILALLFTAPCLAQSASVRADGGLPHDNRPFGKYLVEICTLLSGENRTLSCVPTPLAHDIGGGRPADIRTALQIDQTITLKLICDPNAKNSCNQQTYPPVAGTDFFVSASADSGRIVRQTVLSGNATPVGGTGTIRYRADSPGSIIIRATQTGNERFRAAAPVDLVLQVVDSPEKVQKPCSWLPATQNVTTTPLDAASIVSLLGNPTPFVLSAQGPNTIAVYSTRQPILSSERTILASFQGAIATLAGRTAGSLGISPAAKPFNMVLSIPHAAALGDLATRVNSLNNSQFTAQDVGSNQVRVTSSNLPDCDTWKSFLTDIRGVAWRLISEPMSKKLFYLSSSDVATGFSGLTSGSPAAPSTSTPPSAPSTTSAPSTLSAQTSNASISIAQPPGSNIQISSDTTPCVVAGLAFGNSNACASPAAPAAPAGGSSSPPSSAPAATSVPKTSLNMNSVAVAMGAGEQSPPDLLVFSDTNPGDDAQVEERLRVIAQLDLPRPEMIISAWVTQNSSTSAQAIGAFTNMVKGMVTNYNQQFENVVLRGWTSVKIQSQAPGYFNEGFRSYVEDRFVADGALEKPGSSPQEQSQAMITNGQATLALPIANNDEIKGPWICAQSRYCLGYNSLFHPLKPALTDLLLTIIAAQNPVEVSDKAIEWIETGDDSSAAFATPDTFAIAADQAKALANTADTALKDLTEAVCEVNLTKPEDRVEARKRCRAIWNNLELDHVSADPFDQRTCADRDYRGIIYFMFKDIQNSKPPRREPRVHLQCFKEEIHRLLQAAPDGRVYGAGLLRAAVADFLYNYKLSQQYPHEFAPYELTRSADALNGALSPLIDAFNRDITTYQLFVRADMQYQVERLNSRQDERCCVKRLFGLDKPSFFNDGLVTVRTISGQSTTVNTTTQSFLNVSSAPQLAALLNSFTAGANNKPGANSVASGVLSAGSTSAVTALANLLATYQTTSAQIGRGLNITALPRSLSTASSAEISVTLNADESGGPSLYSMGDTKDPALNTSRVASHDTTTRVRVDSVKLFEISSLTAILERSRSRFPLLPPFVEIPYIGTLAGIPLGAAKEFHSSTAIVSAYVVPTASDIAYGLRFVSDLVVDALNPGRCSFYKGAAGPDVPNACLFRKALSLHDFGHRDLGNFNKTMMRCLANDKPASECQSITFDSVPSMYR